MVKEEKKMHTFGRIVAHDPRDDAHDDAGPGGDKARGRGGGHQARNGPGTPADHRPLPGESPIEENPGDGGEGGGQVGVPAGHGRPQVGPERRAPVKAQPAEPEEHGPQQDEGDVMGTEIQHHAFLPTTEHHRIGQGRQAGTDLDGPAAGIVHDAISKPPAIDIPRPAGERAVDDGGPDEGKDHGG